MPSKGLRTLMALVALSMPQFANVDAAAPIPRGAPGSSWGGRRVSNRRRAIKLDLADARDRAELIRSTPKLRNAGKRVRQGRLAPSKFRALVAQHGAS